MLTRILIIITGIMTALFACMFWFHNTGLGAAVVVVSVVSALVWSYMPFKETSK